MVLTSNRMAHYPECNPTRFMLFLLCGITAVDKTILCSFAQNTKGYMWRTAHSPPRSTEKVKERIHMRSMSSNSTKDSNVCQIHYAHILSHLGFTDLVLFSHSSTVTTQLLQPMNPMGLLLFERHTKYPFFSWALRHKNKMTWAAYIMCQMPPMWPI